MRLRRLFRSPQTRKVVSGSYLLLLVGASLWVVSRLNYESLRSLDVLLLPILAAIAVGLITRYWMTYVWLSALSMVGERSEKPSWTHALTFFSSTWLSRYFPLKGAWLIHRLALAKHLNVSKTTVAGATALEGFALLVATSLVAMLALLSSLREVSSFEFDTALWLVALGIIGAFFVPPIVKRIMAAVAKRSSRLTHLAQVRYRGIIVIGGLQIVTAVLSATSTILIVSSVSGTLGLAQVLYIGGLTALGNLAGTLAVFAPAGLGVREAVLIAGLQSLTNFEVATFVAVAARFWSVLVDLLFFMAVRLTIGHRRRTGNELL